MIEVKYSCKPCRLHRIKVQVRERNLPDEDVVQWMKGAVITAIGEDHRKRSPWCRATEISEVMLPVPPGEGPIGGPTVQ